MSAPTPLPKQELQAFLNEKYQQYARAAFVQHDPVQIPHLFTRQADIELSGFITATISWGKRELIIRSARELFRQMDDAPADFIVHGQPDDFARLADFYYRTFQPADLQYFLRALQHIYRQHGGLQPIIETAYQQQGDVYHAWVALRQRFFELPGPSRTQKHVSDVTRNASAKRLNMFLRWMVRPATAGIDFGLWQGIPPAALYLPLDVHTARAARALGLLSRKASDWKSVQEVTRALRTFDAHDPVKYDFALFGLGVYEGFGQ